jgi:hypothetical protein
VATLPSSISGEIPKPHGHVVPQHVSPASCLIYYAEIGVAAGLDEAWEALVDYQSWNPSFASAITTTVRGDPRETGGIVHIAERDEQGMTINSFFAETARIRPGRGLAWFVYPPVGEAFRNYLDFELVPDGESVQLQVRYYAQLRTPLEPEEAAVRTAEGDTAYLELARSFRDYVEALNTEK